MDRRNFLKTAGMAGAVGLAGSELGAAPVQTPELKTKHLIWLINGNGSRKKEWYENPELQPNYARLVREGFVFEEDYNHTVSEHGNSWTELLQGNENQSSIPLFPTVPNYVRKHHGDQATNYFYLNGVSYYRQWRFSEKYFTVHPDFGPETRPLSLTASHIYNSEAHAHNPVYRKQSPRDLVRSEFPDVGLTEPEAKQLEEFIEDTLQRRVYDVTGLKHPSIPRDPFLGDAMALAVLPDLMKAFKPRMIIYQQVGHDTGHGAGGFLRQQTGFFEYEKVAKTTDELIGKIIDFVENDPYFRDNTAIVVRPEFGRDDEVNMYGEINHSGGYYYCHSSASIFWGPDFKKGKTNEVVNRLDVCPTLTKLFGADAPYSVGLVRPQMFKDEIARQLPAYRNYTPA